MLREIHTPSIKNNIAVVILTGISIPCIQQLSLHFSISSQITAILVRPSQMSIPAHCRPSRSAATGVVAQSQKGSRTISTGLLLA